MQKQILFIALGLLFTFTTLAEERNTQSINLVMSVDWEGFSLEPENIEAFRKFREDYPHIKIVHFLNSAYYTKPGANGRETTQIIQSVLRPGDEFGLHIHAFESLLDRAGVEFKDEVTFWGKSASKKINGDRGHDVSLSVFSVSEMRKIIRTSIDILEENGFRDLRSFRAGGWIATPSVLEAVRREGLTIDSSAVSPAVVGMVATEDQPLFQLNQELWPDQTPDRDEPYQILTKAGSITEIPNNVALADYIKGEEAFEIFESLLNSNSIERARIFHFGFHQETAARFLPRVRVLLKKIDKYTQRYLVDVRPVTFEEITQGGNRVPVSESGRSCKQSLWSWLLR